MHQALIAALLAMGLFVASANLTVSWKQWRRENRRKN